MIVVFLLYGLAFFTLGLAALLESRRNSASLLARQLPWLAAFALSHAAVEWGDLVDLVMPGSIAARIASMVHIVVLPLSALFLIRFGVGLISESGPLPRWLLLFPAVFIAPAALIATYAIIVSLTEPDIKTASDIWSRYLLYIPGAALAATGFFRQAYEASSALSTKVRSMMVAAGGAFVGYGLFAGLIVPRADFGLAPWLNYDFVMEISGFPVQIWRTIIAFGMTVFVIRALDIFEVERKQELEILALQRDEAEVELQLERERAQEAQLRAQKEARRVAETWVNALVEIGKRIVHMESADAVLKHIVSQGQRLLQADSVTLGLFDETGQHLELKYQSAGGKTSAFNQPFRLDNDDLLRMLRSGRSFCFPEDRHLSDVTWYCPTVRREIKAAAVVPLQFDEQVVGGVWAARFAPQTFTPAQLFGLQNLADQAVIALQHASMAAQLQTVATLEERSRIAREMHDGLAQILGYLGLQMQTIEAYVKAGKQIELLDEIAKTRQNIKLAQADVRENILSLRTTLAGDAGLISALQEYVTEFGVQTATRVQFKSELRNEPNLSPIAEVQLVRIVQEALTNVRKHAKASRVDVKLASKASGLAISVIDDGVGFQTNGATRSFGLHTMTERAESVGGRLAVESEPQRGTAIRLWLPLLVEQREKYA